MNTFLTRLKANGLALSKNSNLSEKELVSHYLTTTNDWVHDLATKDAGIHLTSGSVASHLKEIALIKKLETAGQRPGCLLMEMPDAVRPTFILTERDKDPLDDQTEIVKISLFIPSILTDSKIGYVRVLLNRGGHSTSQPFVRTQYLKAGIEEILALEVTNLVKSISSAYPHAEISLNLQDNTEVEDIVAEFFRC